MCLALGILTSLLGAIVIGLVLPFLSPQFATANYYTSYILVFVIGVILCTVTTLVDQTFVAERASSNMALRNAAFAIFKLLIMIPLIQIGALGIFASWVLALAVTVLLAALILIPRLKRHYHLAIRGMRAQIRPMLSSFTGNHFISVGGMLPMYLLPVFVAIRLSATDNAYFYLTWMMCSVFFMVSPAVATALFSEGSHTASDIMLKARNSLLIIGLLLSPILLIFFVGGRYLLSLFGPNYPQHGLVLLTLLAISAVPDAITNIYVSLLRVHRRLRSAALLNLGMAITALTLAWILLPTLGIAGAGWAWLIGQSAGSVVVGADLLIFHSYARNTTKEGIILDTMPLSVEQNYAVAQAVWLLDTTVLPALKLSSVTQSMKIPVVGPYQREKDLSLLETTALPAMKPPSTAQPQRRQNRSMYRRIILQKEEE
jgi:O-antigen/teichoic acid export membrane protein